MRNEVIVEAIGGYFAIYGLGRIMSGRLVEGIGVMVGYWVFSVAFVFVSYIAILLTLGMAGCVILPIAAGMYIGLPIYSAYKLNEQIAAEDNQKWLGIKRK